jgi:hypothetical protein
MGAGKVLSFDNWQENARRVVEPTCPASRVRLLARSSGGWTLYWLLSRDGCCGDYQAVMYFFGFLGLRALARKRESNSIPKGSNEQ